MKITIEQKRNLLNDAVRQLKKEFTGIYGIIDELADVILTCGLITIIIITAEQRKKIS
jgi:hypothetical protein